MVNLSTFKIRITGTIPKRFRELVEDAIYDTFYQHLIDYTKSFESIDSKKLWKVEYEPWHGFVIEASDTKKKNYAQIIKWINYGAQSHFIQGIGSAIHLDKVGREVFVLNRNKLKFLCFDDVPRKHRMAKISGNIVFKENGKIFALVVEHPGIEAKRFVENIIENSSLNNAFLFQIIENNAYNDLSFDEQRKLFKKLNVGNRDVIGVSSE
jgi:hypothetical protein